jgi:hypothetical protein
MKCIVLTCFSLSLSTFLCLRNFIMFYSPSYLLFDLFYFFVFHIHVTGKLLWQAFGKANVNQSVSQIIRNTRWFKYDRD